MGFDPSKPLHILFLLNGLGYVGLLGVLYLPQLEGFHTFARWTLVVYAAITIVAWLILAQPYHIDGYIDKAIEIVLIVLLFVESWQVHAHRE